MSKSVLFAALAPQPDYTDSQAVDADLPPSLRGRYFTWQPSLAQRKQAEGFIVEKRGMSQPEAEYINSRQPKDLEGSLLTFEREDDIWLARPYLDADLQPGLADSARRAVAKYSPTVQVAGFQVLPGPATNDISDIDSETLRNAVETLRLRKQLDAYWTEQTALYRSIGVQPSEATQARLDRLAVLLAMTAQPAAFVETSTAFMDRYLPGFSSKGATNRSRFGAPQLVAAVVAFVVAIPVAYFLYAALIGLAAYTISYLKAAVEIQRLDLELTTKLADICNDPNATPEARAAACKYLKDHKPPEPPPDLSDLLMWGGVAVVGLFGASIMLPVLADSARDSLRGRRD